MDVKSYPTIKEAIILCIMYCCIALVSGLIWGIVSVLCKLVDPMIYHVSNLLLSLLTMCIVISFGFIKTKQKINDVFKFNNVSLELWKATTVLMIGLVILLSEINHIFCYFLPPPDFLISMFKAMVVEQMFIMSIISIGIIPAFTEEMLFRGIILNGFKNNYSEKKAILVSALLFGFWHLNPWQFGSAFILGLLTAFICLRTGSILLCIYIHLFNNVLAVIVVRIMTINGLSSVYSKEIFQLVWLDIIGMIITIFGIIWLAKGIKNFNKTKNENDYFI